MLAMAGGLAGFLGQAGLVDDTAAPSATPANPFSSLTNRNAFGIKPPPLPPEPAPVQPAVPPPNLFLTGVSVLNGLKRAYLVVTKANGKQPEYLAVDEGYDNDGLQVLGIDPRKQVVRVRNMGNEVTLNFKENGLKSVAAAPPPGVPSFQGGAPIRGIPAPPGGANPPATTTAPTIIGRGGVAAATATAQSAVMVQPFVQVADEAPVARQLPARRGVYLGGNAAAGPVTDAGGGKSVPSIPGPVSNLLPGHTPPPLPVGR